MVEWNEEERMLLEMVRKYTKQKLAPSAQQYEKDACFDRAHWNEMGDLGLTGLPVSAEFGGSGMSLSILAAVVEDLAKGSSALAASFLVHSTVTYLIQRFGTDIQKSSYLPELVSGRRLAALAITEPGAGSDMSAISTTAVRNDKHYVLDGQKIFITSGGAAQLYLVMTKTDLKGGAKGLTAFLVDPALPGFVVGRIEDKMGQAACPTAQLFFENLTVPATNRLGEEGQGFSLIMTGLNRSRILVAAASVGLAQAAFDVALAYASERKQFNRTIIENQGIRWMFAKMATSIEASRLMAYHAAGLADMKRPFVKEAAMAKALGSDTAMDVTTDCVQILGGYGYIKDFPVERFMREAKLMQIVEGTNQIQLEIIFRELWQAEGKDQS